MSIRLPLTAVLGYADLILDSEARTGFGASACVGDSAECVAADDAD